MSRLDSQFQMKHRHFTGLNYQSEIAQIANGQMNVFAGYEWNSWLEALQTPLVFLGIWPIGVRDAQFSYGRPWVWEAALVMDVLRRHHQEIPLTPLPTPTWRLSSSRMASMRRAIRSILDRIRIELPSRPWTSCLC